MLTDIVNTYLSVRRAVGFKLHSCREVLMELCELRNCPRRYPGAQHDRC